MLSLLLGLDFLISGWISAHLLALLAVYLLVRFNHLDHLVRWIEILSPSEFYHRTARKIFYVFMVALIGMFLTILMSIDPIQVEMIPRFIQNLLSDNFWTQYYYFIDDLLLAAGLIVLISFVPIINRIFQKIFLTIDTWRHTRFRVVRIQNLELLTPDQLADLIAIVAKYVRIGLIFLVASSSITLVFSLYPQTKGIAQAFLEKVMTALDTIWGGVLDFLPNLITLLAIIVFTRLTLKALRFFYVGLQRGKVRYSGIHPELVEPTYQLLRFLVIAFALVAAFPYIPGSSSPVFRGLSIFIGFLLSLGSTSLVTNIVSGIVLTYSRGLKIGDRVEIGDSLGDVIDRTLLVTRIRTIKNVVVTIPNGMVMQNQIINYSADAENNGLILNTSVSIGYDVPWRHVHQLLIDAALETPEITQFPNPFVLQTSLDDFYVNYELNAYTGDASKMANTYSQLHQNILDQFNQASVEIMSPSYFAFRQGGNITIPEVNSIRNGHR